MTVIHLSQNLSDAGVYGGNRCLGVPLLVMRDRQKMKGEEAKKRKEPLGTCWTFDNPALPIDHAH